MPSFPAWRAALVLCLWAGLALAQDVTLSSRDGGVTLSGTLQGFDGEFYRVDTAFGTLTLDASGVDCAGPGCPDLSSFVARITISGSAEPVAGLLPDLLAAFAGAQDYRLTLQQVAENTDEYLVTDTVSGRLVAIFVLMRTSTDEGFADLISAEAQLVLAMREVLPDEVIHGEAAGLGTLGDGAQGRSIALEAIVPVVAPANSLDVIAQEDLLGVLSGSITNWREIGGVDAPIALHLREPGLGVNEFMQERLLLPRGLLLSGEVHHHRSDAALAAAVAADPFGLGMILQSAATGLRQMSIVGECGTRNRADEFTIRSGDYPLTLPILLYSGAGRLPRIGRELLRFIQTPAGQAVVAAAGHVDQRPAVLPLDGRGETLARAIVQVGATVGLEEVQRLARRLTGFSRLSVTFRYDAGSAELDAQSRSNVQVLARLIEAELLDAREVLFVGFSDGEGNAEANLRVSRERAAAVRAAVMSAALMADRNSLSVGTEAFGEAFPLACDDNEWGRRINRRVEVWIR